MSKEKLEKDYLNFNQNIKQQVEEELKNIREKANAIKEEAGRMGEAVEASLNARDPKSVKKKVNS
jgi:hypothetical protein